MIHYYKDILQKAKMKDPDALYFFQDKFGLVQMIATLKTPYVAVLDGYACKMVYDMNDLWIEYLLHKLSGRCVGLVYTWSI